MHPKSAPSRPLANAQAAYPSFDQRQRVLEWLDEQVPKSRVEHILRVEDMAIALAEHHGVSTYKAAQAGLMHDLAKYFKPKRLLELAIADGLDLDPVYRENPRLLHADVGAIVARDEFGVKDGDVLRAIANHTLGTPGMDTLSCIVFLADSLEPGRGDSDDLHHLRTLSFQDLKRAVWMTCDYTIQHLLRTKKLIHPRAIATRNWFLQNAKKHDLASSTKK
jgi:predicted HD superfamily hydrolase involved in NAD metabolism